MKQYKGNILLVELMIVILFFSLSQLVVVRLFLSAHEKATDARILSAALLCGEDVAERLAGEPNPDGALLGMGFMGGNGSYVRSDSDGFDLLVNLKRETGAAGDLIRSTVTAQANGKELFALSGAYYAAKEATP